VTGRGTRSCRLVKVNFSLSRCFLITTQDYFAGARACLGRRCVLLQYNGDQSSRTIFRFFETEAIVVLTMLVSKYKISIKEEPEFSGETFEERYARITAFDQALTTV